MGAWLPADAYGGGPVNDFSLTMANGYSYDHPPTADTAQFTALKNQYVNLSSTLARTRLHRKLRF